MSKVHQLKAYIKPRIEDDPAPRAIENPNKVWYYIVMLHDSKGGITLEELSCVHPMSPTCNESMLRLCDAAGIARARFIGAFQIDPLLRVKFADDGSMIRITPRTE